MFRLWRDKGRNHSCYRFAVCLPRRSGLPGFAFRDMPAPTDWSHEGLDYCIYRGYIAGTSASTVAPTGVCTRAQLVSILYRVQGEPAKVNGYELKKLGSPFRGDVPSDAWYTDAIWWAKLTGVVSGTSATTFDPSGEITREQLAVILYNYTKQFAPGSLTATGSLAGFPDAGQRLVLGAHGDGLGRRQRPHLRHRQRRRRLPQPEGQRHARAGRGHPHAL